jgi:hypothetical protein
VKDLIIGFGQIGKAVQEAICFDQAKTLDSTAKDIMPGVNVMHVCFPYSDDFISQVTDYIKRFQPEHIVIYSTVPIGTCGEIDSRVVHSPIEGNHPNLDLSIRHARRWVGYNNEEEGRFFKTYYANKGLSSKLVPSTHFTEALKLLSTTEYGLNIEFARYKKHIADELGMTFDLTKEWNLDYNKLYKNLGLGDRYQKFILDAPEGSKGGHCVTPNARLLFEQYPAEILREVAEL